MMGFKPRGPKTQRCANRDPRGWRCPNPAMASGWCKNCGLRLGIGEKQGGRRRGYNPDGCGLANEVKTHRVTEAELNRLCEVYDRHVCSCRLSKKQWLELRGSRHPKCGKTVPAC